MDADAPALHPRLVDISELTLDPKNARLHNESNLGVIGYSLGKYSQTKPVIVNSRTGIVVAGNGTITQALAMGHEQIVAVFKDMTDAEAAEYAILDNRSAELATWNAEQLAETIGDNPALDWGAGGWAPTDFDAFDVDWPLAELSTVSEHEREAAGDDDDDLDDDEAPIPEVPAEPITQPGEVIQIGPHVLHCADCMDVMRSLPDNSVDAIVTDPPYGLSPDGRARTWDDIEALRAQGKGPTAGFMGRAWDAGVPGVTWARECLRVLKPGGHLIAFSATRTYHRLACAVEDAGFEIRDMIAWLQYQGFPKSRNVSKDIDAMHGAERSIVGSDKNRGVTKAADGKAAFGDYAGSWDITAAATEDAKAWDGWGTALKPSIEPHVLARKPLSESTVAANVLKWGTGALNIDACRYARGDAAWPGPDESAPSNHGESGCHASAASSYTLGARSPQTTSGQLLGRWPANIYACPKPATSERSEGCGGLPKGDRVFMGSGGRTRDSDGEWVETHSDPIPRENSHPTVKPVRLMRWLLRLVTPPGGTVVEPFGGSGTTLVAADGLDCKVVVAEREPGYCDIIRARGEWSIAARPEPARKPGRPRTAARDGDKRQARRRVQTLIQNGTLPAPADVVCVDCKAAPGREYDHHLGYGAAHHEDVEALCATCHHAREAERANAKTPAGAGVSEALTGLGQIEGGQEPPVRE